MSFSYSKVSCFNSCPYHYKLSYIDKLRTKFDEKPTNALCLGTAVHEGIENGSLDKAVESYKSNYSIWDDNNDIEVYKLEKIVPKAIEQIPKGEYEYKLLDDDGFVGYIDLLVKIDDNTYDLYDFKYSNNVSGYRSSGQIHVYKYYYEKLTGNKIRKMYYAMIPKCPNKLEEDLSVEDVRSKIDKYLDKRDIKFEEIEFDPMQVRYFFARKTLMEKAVSYEKRYSTTCMWCEFQKYCKSNGRDRSELDEPQEEVQLFSAIDV